MRPVLCLLLSIPCLLASCDVKKLSRQIESTQTIPINATTQLTRTQIDPDWSRIGTCLFHRNGIDWIEFDSISRIDFRPGEGLRAIGYNPRLHGHLASTYRDSSAKSSTTRTRIEKDSKGQNLKTKTKKVLNNRP